ncbi:acetyltransferase [Listeria rocourtiae]|uniref:acetyltransferase n=1 Tax=Listeria rocourtiae TaxID=647910 RepID=UPI0016266101|nr:acetyltransferase [Listeria rocourtiae]MBC1434945.1 acetyltransferase [Listeria rocourtiae]
MRNVIIVGDGGHSKVVRECLEQQGIYTIIGVLDNKYTSYEERDGQFRAPLDDFSQFKSNTTLWFIAIGDNKARAEVAIKLGDVSYATIIHPTAIVSKMATVEPGSVIMPLAVIQPDSVIGAHTIINTGAIIEHDVIISEAAHVSPRATITGGVKIGVGVHVGASAVVNPGLSLGDYSIVGAGAVVVSDTEAGGTYVGVPARKLEK